MGGAFQAIGADSGASGILAPLRRQGDPARRTDLGELVGHGLGLALPRDRGEHGQVGQRGARIARSRLRAGGAVEGQLEGASVGVRDRQGPLAALAIEAQQPVPWSEAQDPKRVRLVGLREARRQAVLGGAQPEASQGGITTPSGHARSVAGAGRTPLPWAPLGLVPLPPEAARAAFAEPPGPLHVGSTLPALPLRRPSRRGGPPHGAHVHHRAAPGQLAPGRRSLGLGQARRADPRRPRARGAGPRQHQRHACGRRAHRRAAGPGRRRPALRQRGAALRGWQRGPSGGRHEWADRRCRWRLWRRARPGGARCGRDDRCRQARGQPSRLQGPPLDHRAARCRGWRGLVPAPLAQRLRRRTGRDGTCSRERSRW